MNELKELKELLAELNLKIGIFDSNISKEEMQYLADNFEYDFTHIVNGVFIEVRKVDNEIDFIKYEDEETYINS